MSEDGVEDAEEREEEEDEEGEEEESDSENEESSEDIHAQKRGGQGRLSKKKKATSRKLWQISVSIARLHRFFNMFWLMTVIWYDLIC